MVSVVSDINTRRQYSIFELLRNKAFSIPCLFSSFAAFVLLARSHLYANDLNEQQVWTIGLGVVSGVAILRWLCGFPAVLSKTPVMTSTVPFGNSGAESSS